MAADPEYTRYIGGPNTDRAVVWHSTARQLGTWALRGLGLWAVVELATGETVGRAGLWWDPGWPGIEAAWFIARHGGAAATRPKPRGPPCGSRSRCTTPTGSSPSSAPTTPRRSKVGERVDHREYLHGAEEHVYAVTRDERQARQGPRAAGWHMNIPTLTSERLILRPIGTDDLPGYLSIWADPEFTEYLGGPATDPDRMWHAMAGNTGCWNLTGVGPWSVVECATGDLVGRAGLRPSPEGGDLRAALWRLTSWYAGAVQSGTTRRRVSTHASSRALRTTLSTVSRTTRWPSWAA